MSLPTEQVLLVAVVLFGLGLLGLLIRRDLVFVLMSLEILLSATVLAFGAAGARWGQADGQVWILFVLATAAAEISVALPLLLQLNRRRKLVDSELLTHSDPAAPEGPEQEEDAP